MCGIGGIIPLTPLNKENMFEYIKSMLSDLEIRGTDATGIASWEKETGDITICKQANKADLFIKNLTVDHIKDIVICHTRAKTKGEPENPENNHPIYGSNYVIIHNGSVHSMKDIDTYKYKGECDTERLLSYIETYGLKDGIPKIDGSASFCLFSQNNRTIYLYKKTSPLVISLIPGKVFMFASTDVSLKNIGKKLCDDKIFGIFNSQLFKDVEENNLISINIDTFDIKIEMIK